MSQSMTGSPVAVGVVWSNLGITLDRPAPRRYTFRPVRTTPSTK